jgi:hypothetical protein
MILRDIYIDLDRAQYSTKVAYAFKLRSRCVCNFVGRHVWKEQIRAPGFNRISVTLSKCASPKFEVNSCQVGCITMPFEESGYEGLSDTDFHELVITHLLSACDQFLRTLPEVFGALKEAVRLFREVGYRNEWVARSRRFAAAGINASLACELTPLRFGLRLVIRHRGTLVFDQEIFTSDPDEVAFDYRFKDIVLIDDKLVVTSKTSKPLLELSVSRLLEKGRPNQPPDPRRGCAPPWVICNDRRKKTCENVI